MLPKLLNLLILIGFLCSHLKAEEFLECFDEDDGTFVAYANNCSKAIYCNGDYSRLVDCDSQRPYFSTEDNGCVIDSNKCGNRPFDSTTTVVTPIISIISTSTASSSTTDTTSTSFTTATPTTTLTSTLTSTTFVPQSPTSTLNPSTSLWCPAEDDPTKPLFLPHPKSCSQYFLCYHGVATVMQCPNMLYFDATLQSCNTADQVKCQITDVSPRDQCLPHTVDVYPHASNCNYYYLCEYGYLMIMQCPFNMGWDYEKKICVKKSQVKCYKDTELEK